MSCCSTGPIPISVGEPVVLWLRSSSLRTGRSPPPASGSSPFRPFHLFRFATSPASAGASPAPRSGWRPHRTVSTRKFSLEFVLLSPSYPPPPETGSVCRAGLIGQADSGPCKPRRHLKAHDHRLPSECGRPRPGMHSPAGSSLAGCLVGLPHRCVGAYSIPVVRGTPSPAPVGGGLTPLLSGLISPTGGFPCPGQRSFSPCSPPH